MNPSHERELIPWTDIEEAGGKSVSFIADHPYLIIAGGTLLYLKNRKKK